MDSNELYQHLKDALNFFGLDWKDKALMSVAFEKDKIILICGRETIIHDTREIINERKEG